MVCELNTRKELSLSEMIKILYEFDDLDKLYTCVNKIKDEYSIDELNELSDEDIYEIFISC
ncbi:MAG: hypothetical protein BZ136_01055 [Methanosphaera sp. rholeuAM74]|nr:MAG: hypothetical protein BZ136_01055 [Methanosphaera sp. rholeuAM74]